MTIVAGRQHSTSTSKPERESFDFYRSSVETGAVQVVVIDETARIEANDEFYNTILTRLETFGELIPAEDVLGDLDAD